MINIDLKIKSEVALPIKKYTTAGYEPEKTQLQPSPKYILKWGHPNRPPIVPLISS